MMDLQQIHNRLASAVKFEGDDVAIRVHAQYEPQMGASAKVFPPTYLASPDGSKYHFEQRWGPDGDEVEVALLDSFQSQANRVETAILAESEELGVPQLVLEADLPDRKVRISSLQASHRSRDAYFLDSLLDGGPFDRSELGTALANATTENATAFLAHAPCDLVYGVWDSHRGRRIPTKFPRSYVSEMIGWHVLRGKKGATKTDPLNLPGADSVPLTEWRPNLQSKNKKGDMEKLSELGHGNVPVPPEEAAGGVSVQTITRDAVISLTGLAALQFPTEGGDVNVPGRVALACLALVGDRLAFGRAGINLRSGCELVRTTERMEWVQVGGSTEPVDISVDDARTLLQTARQGLADAGVSWQAEPVVLQPTPQLQEIIERTFYVAELDADE